MAQTVINDTQGVVTREAGTGTRLENNVVMTGNIGVGADPGVGRAIGSLTLTNAGSGATNGTYSQVALTGGSGTGATADIVVAGNVVTSLVLRNPGQGYAVGDTLSTAAIGGTGFVFTVASIASVLRSDGNVVGNRIGIGTQTPIAPFHSTGFGIFEGSSVFARSVSFSTPTVVRAGLVHSLNFVSDANVTSNVAIGAYESFDFSASTTFQYGYSIDTTSTASASLAGGQISIRGGNFVAQRNATNDLATNATVIGSVSNANVASTTGAASTSGMIGISGLSQNNKSGHNVTTLTAFQASASAVAGASVTTGYGFYLTSTNTASTWTTLYGMRLANWSGPTITNRWGISQEDAAANNVYAGKSALGQAAGTVPTANADIGASTTAAAALRIRSGVAPTAPNDGDIWFDGSAIKVQIGGVTRTVTVT